MACEGARLSSEPHLFVSRSCRRQSGGRSPWRKRLSQTGLACCRKPRWMTRAWARTATAGNRVDKTSRTPVWSVTGKGLGDRERELSGGPGFQLGGRADGGALPCV